MKTCVHALAAKFRPLAVSALMFSAALLPGCAAGPDFHRPAPPLTRRYTRQPLPATLGQGDDAQRFVRGMDVPAQWWTLFRSPQLDALVAQTLKANPDLAAAQAALRQAQEAAAAQKASLFPSAVVDYNVNRQRTASTLASPLASGVNYYTLHTAQISVSYAPDVFGGGRRQLESLRAQAEVQRFQLEATYLSLTTNVVVAAINEAGLRAQVSATQRIVADQRRTLDSLQRQYALGQVPEAAIAAQRAALAQTEAGLPPLQKQLEQQRDALAALLGAAPADAPTTRFDLTDLQLPHELPLSVPARLVAQRPDVRAAEAQLRAASAAVGVAIANRLPKFVLSADAGSASTDIARLFAHGTLFWNLAADIAEPIFDAGSLKHQQRAAEAAFDGSKAQYRATVIAALQNVADVLYALKSDADALTAAQTAEHAAARGLDITRRQFELGDVSYLAMLQAEQAEQQSKLALAQAMVNRYSDTVALFQALGGSGWSRNDGGASAESAPTTPPAPR